MVIKMAFSYKDCIKEGLLRKIPPSRENAKSSLRKAESWLEDAEKSLKGEAFNSSVHASYMAMFHAARSILFFDGFRKKSHTCVARYLEEKYVNTKKLEKTWVEILDHQREIRHEGQYDLSFFSTGEEAKEALDSAGKFLERLKHLFHQLIEQKEK
jgi:uncharacterized protein (UPF0332 family)